MNVEQVVLYIAAALFVGLLISMYVKHRAKPVDKDHKAPNVHNVQMKGKVGPATAAEKPAAKTTKKTSKKTTKKTSKKTSKKTATKKK